MERVRVGGDGWRSSGLIRAAWSSGRDQADTTIKPFFYILPVSAPFPSVLRLFWAVLWRFHCFRCRVFHRSGKALTGLLWLLW